MSLQEREPFYKQAGKTLGPQELLPAAQDGAVGDAPPKLSYDKSFDAEIRRKYAIFTDGTPQRIKADFEKWLELKPPVSQ